MRRNVILLFMIMISMLSAAQEVITMRNDNGVYTIPCTVNGLRLRFIFDTGASDVSISAAEALFMLKNEYLSLDDIVDSENYTLADGTILENTIINIPEIKIGTKTLTNVRACVVKNINAPLLLGQSAIKQLGPWYIEEDKLIFGKPSKQSSNSVVNETPIEKCIEEAKKCESCGDYETAISLYKKACSIKNYANYYEFASFCLGHSDLDECKNAVPFNYIYQAALDGYQPMIDLLKRFPLVFGWDKANGLRYYSDLIKNRNLWFLCNQAAYYCFKSSYFNNKTKGWEFLQIGVEHNDPRCFSFLATKYDPHYYIEGEEDFIKRDKKEAIELYKKAIKLGDTSVCYNCGVLLLEDKNNKDNYQLGISYLKKAGELGDSWAMKELMEEFYYGEFADDDKSLYWAQRITENPSEENFDYRYAKSIMGTIYYHQNKYEEAFSHLLAAHTSRGERIWTHPTQYSILLLAECYYWGDGTSKDYSLAHKYYSEYVKDANNESKLNLIYAYNKLGYMYKNGLGVPQDASKSFFCYIKSANHDDPLAEASVADAYLDGNGIAKDINKAIFWFEKAAQQGHAYSWYSLGCIYAVETYGYYSMTKAVECFNKAIECDKDSIYSSECYYKLGLIYEYGGNGISKSYFKAGTYYKKAAELGHDKAKGKMKEFE